MTIIISTVSDSGPFDDWLACCGYDVTGTAEFMSTAEAVVFDPVNSLCALSSFIR